MQIAQGSFATKPAHYIRNTFSLTRNDRVAVVAHTDHDTIRSADMTIIETLSKTGRAAAADLRSSMQGEVCLLFDDDYAEASRLWNGAVNHQPALIARCETRHDVQVAVRAARAHGLAVSMRGGSHDWPGRALRRDGLVIDLSAMRQVSIQPATKVAIVSGGATAKDVIAAAAPYGLAAVTGNCGTVGMVGLTLRGGYGPLIGRYGLVADNLLEAEVVLTNGQHVVANRDRNAVSKSAGGMRLIGHPARAASLARFLDYVQGHEGVWVTRRLDIARHWAATHPFAGKLA
jgi:FAD/FMN-containing dehydrogenase